MCFVKESNSVVSCGQPVLLAIVTFSKPYHREELWACPNDLGLVDQKRDRECRKLGINFEDYLWALEFSREEFALTRRFSR